MFDPCRRLPSGIAVCRNGQGPAALWDFSDGYRDSSGNDRHASIGALERLGTGYIGNGIASSGDTAHVPPHSSLDIRANRPGTIVFWYRRPANDSARDEAFLARYQDMDPDNSHYFIGWLGASRRIWVLGDGRNGGIRYDVPNGVDLTGWHHVAIVLRGENSQIYFDGEVRVAGNVNLSPQSSNRLIELGGGLGRLYHGSLDEVAIYPFGLTAQEIDRLYRAQ